MKPIQLFPELAPRRSGILLLDGGHTLYWEELGNPDGVPLVFLHGGPGAGTPITYRRHFDPAFYRIVMYDQRGAGRSAPVGTIAGNTTQHLIDDLERLRAHLGIAQWVVAGASWGTTLALAYGETHPERCLGFLLRGIFLGRASEIDWFLHGMRNIFPEAWERFAAHVPADDRGDLLGAYYRRLTCGDAEVELAAAKAWSRYEGACSSLLPVADVEESFADQTVALGLGRIEAHYFKHSLFLAENALLKGLAAIRDKPAIITQGRYDVICPIVTAHDLAGQWPSAEFRIVPDGGHSGMDPAITAAQIEAGERLKPLLH